MNTYFDRHIRPAPDDFLGFLIERELRHIESWAETVGVTIKIAYDQLLFISNFSRDRDNPKTKGNGRWVLEAVLTLADRLGLETELECSTEKRELAIYYACFGFWPVVHQNGVTALKRLPRVQVAA